MWRGIKKLMQSNTNTFQKIYGCLLLAFLGVISVSGTIALRNVLHVILLVLCLGYVGYEWRRKNPSIGPLLTAVPLPVYFWGAYLLLFPLVAPNGASAMENLMGKGMWGESLLTWVLAWGAFLVLGGKRLNLWVLALVSAVPVMIHLVLTVLAWADVLQPAFYEQPSLETAWQSLWTVMAHPSQIKNAFQAFPMGFRGIEPMHGNLGYPASQAMCLGLAVMLAAWHRADRWTALKSGTLVAMCFVSVVIAQSRAAAYFGLFILALSYVAYRFGVSQKTTVKPQSRLGWRVGLLVVGAGALCMAFFAKVASENLAWYSMWDKMAIGFQIEKPKDVICNGLSGSNYDKVRHQNADKDAAYTQVLIDGLQSDGGRVLMARVGLELSVQNPWGWNGGRDAYQYRMEQACGHTPVMNFSHAHNAWINLTLALGWMGAILYAAVLFNFLRLGAKNLRQASQWPAAIALLLLSAFWLVRGIFDGVYQEHYLQMQAFFLLALYLLIRSNKPVPE
jgi:O-Antigen ligase